MTNVDSFIPRCETNDSLEISSLVASTKHLQFLHAIPNVGLLELSCNENQTLVTGLNLPRLHYEDHPHACFHKRSSKRPLLYHPDYSVDATRLKSFKYWNGPIPPRELVDAGFYMIASNLVRCYSCSIVVHVSDWKKEDDAVDIHYLRSPNCSFLKELLIRVRTNEASRDGAGIPNYHSYNEKPLIKDRVKKEGSSINSSLSVIKTEDPSNINKAHPVTFVNHLIISVIDSPYPPSQQSVSTLVNLPSSSTKLTCAITYSPPREQIILVRCFVSLLEFPCDQKCVICGMIQGGKHLVWHVCMGLQLI